MPILCKKFSLIYSLYCEYHTSSVSLNVYLQCPISCDMIFVNFYMCLAIFSQRMKGLCQNFDKNCSFAENARVSLMLHPYLPIFKDRWFCGSVTNIFYTISGGDNILLSYIKIFIPFDLFWNDFQGDFTKCYCNKSLSFAHFVLYFHRF